MNGLCLANKTICVCARMAEGDGGDTVVGATSQEVLSTWSGVYQVFTSQSFKRLSRCGFRSK